MSCPGDTAKLGDIAEFIRGITFKPNDVLPSGTTGSVRCMRTKNVQTKIDLSDVWSVDNRFVKRANQYLQAGDLLISSANSWNLVGKCCWVPEEARGSTFGGFISALRPNRERVDPRYLYHWFSSDQIQTTVRSFGRQTTNISNLDFTRCLSLLIPLPSLDRQRWIAQVLDSVDALCVKRREAITFLDDLAQSIFIDMFGNPATNDRGWEESLTLREVADISSGITKGRNTPDSPMRSVPYMTVLNVQERRLDLATVKTIEATEVEINRYQLIENDLLLTEGGDPDKLGRGTLWRNELPECIHQNHIFRVRLHRDSGIEPIFLNWLVASERGRGYFLRSAKQTTGIASINATQLKQFPLLTPPIELQRRFVLRLADLEQNMASHVAHLAGLNALFASLQHRAFRGELWADSPTA